MAEKSKNFALPPPKSNKTKRPSTVGVASSSRNSRVPAATMKDKTVLKTNPKSRINNNTTLLGDGDVSIFRTDNCIPDFDAENRQIAYGKFLRTMLQDCMVDEKIEREQTQMDIQMAQLADRFQRTVEQLDKTNKRLKDINFVVEQKRLLDLRRQDCSQFYEMTDKSNAQEMLRNLNMAEQACLNRLETKNVDFGYDKETGHKQLLDAVNDAIEGLEEIKKRSNLDIDKLKEYEKAHKSLDEIEKDRLDIESLKTDFEAKFPKFSERLLKEASEKMANMIETDFDDDDDD